MKNETDMKKNYLTPAMKVRTIQCSQVICMSLTINKGVYADNGESAWSKEETDLTEEGLYDIFLGWG